jgi:hypothetical protein
LRQPITPWTWTAERELAATLTADGHKTNDEIALQLGVSVSTFKRWKETPEFEARVEDLISQYQAKLAVRGYAVKAARVVGRLRHIAKLEKVMAERAKAHAFEKLKAKNGKTVKVPVPGGSTGTIVRQVKGGEILYAVDTGLLAEIDTLWRDISVEVGDWKAKVEHSGNIGGNLSETSIALAKVFSLEQIEAAQEKIRLLESGKPS